MLRCDFCSGTSPNDAKFCIDCGRPIKPPEYTGQTVDLGRTQYKPSIQPSGAPYNKPFTDYSQYDGSFQHKHFATITGAIAFPFVDFSATPQEDGSYFIYRADLRAILQHPNTFVQKTNDGYDIYYYGRKVEFID